MLYIFNNLLHKENTLIKSLREFFNYKLLKNINLDMITFKDKIIFNKINLNKGIIIYPINYNKTLEDIIKNDNITFEEWSYIMSKLFHLCNQINILNKKYDIYFNGIYSDDIVYNGIDIHIINYSNLTIGNYQGEDIDLLKIIFIIHQFIKLGQKNIKIKYFLNKINIKIPTVNLPLSIDELYENCKKLCNIVYGEFNNYI